MGISPECALACLPACSPAQPVHPSQPPPCCPPAGVLAVAPLLLLLSQDPILLRGLSQQRRYFPPVAGVSVYLVLSVLRQLFWGYLQSGTALITLDAASLWFIAKNGGLLLACLPSQLELLRHLWGGRPAAAASGGAMWVLAIAPLNLLPLLLGDIEGLRILAGVGLAGGAVQLASMRSTRLSGMKVI